MNGFYRFARDVKNSSPFLRRAWERWLIARRRFANRSYAAKLAQETNVFRDAADVNDLPAIFGYWSNKYLVPLCAELGFSTPDELFANALRDAAARTDAEALFVSIGAGNCDTEVRVAKSLIASGVSSFTLECLDMNPHMLARGRELAEREGVSQQLAFTVGDFNTWRPTRQYHGVMANQSLHHVVNLEGLLDAIRVAMQPDASFVVSDIIGRNGHRRWPEALREVRRFWRELPPAYRYNRQLRRHEEVFENWDCSHEGFEGIRAQDILPLLLERFHFALYVGFANVVDVFIDRSFGHNFDAAQDRDRVFIDRVHAFDEQALRAGVLTPTHMMAVMTKEPTAPCRCARGLTPEASVRRTGWRRLVQRRRRTTPLTVPLTSDAT